jgi:DeoR/GlpR family transcriptional regulator of sugar metabolism
LHLPNICDVLSSIMDVRERRSLTLERLSEDGRVTVAELSHRTGVSEMTVRRDLEAMEREGVLRRVHGGAVRAAGRSYEPPFALRAGRASDAKERIGRLAASLLERGDTAIVDVGTTALELARALVDAEQLTILTPSLRVANLLAGNASLRVIVSGGIARSGELSLVGDLAERAFADLRCDTAFLGVGGIDLDTGLTEYNLDDARVKRAALASARRRVVLADASKLDQVAFARVCPLDAIDVLVTDSKADSAMVDAIRATGVEVLIA